MGFKSDGVLSQRLKSAAELSEDSLSGETKRRLVLSFDYEDAFEQAMILAFGPDNAHFVYLLAVVVNAFAPQGQWRDDPTIGRSIARGYARLFERLGAPGNGALIDDIKNPEDRVVDKLLDELGHVSRYPSAPTYLERWAEAKRKRLGDLAPLLIEMREAARAYRYENPRAPAEAKPEAVALWDAPLALAGSSDAHVHLPRARLLIERAQDANLDPEAKADVLRQAGELIAWLEQQSGVDAQTIAALRAEIAAAEPSEGCDG